MKFFIPAASGPEQTASIYESIKQFLGEELGAVFADRKVHRLGWMHDGKAYTAEVGQETSVNREPVIAILFEPARDLYHVCTPNRGVLRGMSILAGGHSVTMVSDFEAE